MRRFQPRTCAECGEDYTPVAPIQRYCANCGRPGRGRPATKRRTSRCQRKGCHNLLRPAQTKWCSRACQEGREAHPLRAEKFGPGHPYGMVLDYLLRGRSVEEIAERSHRSAAEVADTLRAMGIRWPRRARVETIPDKLWADLARTPLREAA